jgi:hypothetical protein
MQVQLIRVPSTAPTSQIDTAQNAIHMSIYHHSRFWYTIFWFVSNGFTALDGAAPSGAEELTSMVLSDDSFCFLLKAAGFYRRRHPKLANNEWSQVPGTQTS